MKLALGVSPTPLSQVLAVSLILLSLALAMSQTLINLALAETLTPTGDLKKLSFVFPQAWVSPSTPKFPPTSWPPPRIRAVVRDAGIELQFRILY